MFFRYKNRNIIFKIHIQNSHSDHVLLQRPEILGNYNRFNRAINSRRTWFFLNHGRRHAKKQLLQRLIRRSEKTHLRQTLHRHQYSESCVSSFCTSSFRQIRTVENQNSSIYTLRYWCYFNGNLRLLFGAELFSVDRVPFVFRRFKRLYL